MAETTHVTDNNFIVIQGWMVTDLRLKGNELIIYAAIYGFSQAENQTFKGSLQYLADWTNSTKQGVIKALKSLMEKGMIDKKEAVINGVKFCEYSALPRNMVLNKVERGIKQSLPNNIADNIDYNNTPYNPPSTSSQGDYSPAEKSAGDTPPTEKTCTENPDAVTAEPETKKKPQKHRYGRYNNVLLTDEEYSTLQVEFPSDYSDRIERLSEYIESKGEKYKSHLATIRSWARRDKEKCGWQSTGQAVKQDGDQNFDFFMREAMKT